MRKINNKVEISRTDCIRVTYIELTTNSAS